MFGRITTATGETVLYQGRKKEVWVPCSNMEMHLFGRAPGCRVLWAVANTAAQNRNRWRVFNFGLMLH